MRKLVLWLALGVGGVGGACTSAPPQIPGETTSTGTTSTSEPTSTMGPGGDATTGPGSADATAGDVCPPMPPEDGGYDPCPGLCGGGGQCLHEIDEYAVCTRGCFMDCNCWPAPDGDAPARCSSELLENTSLCVLDCSDGQTCPTGMLCVADLGICAHPYPGSGETTEGVTGDSSSGGSSDSGSTGGSSDSGSSDSGSSDSGSSDSGSSDSGSSDSGTTGGETGTTDGGGTEPGTTSGGSESGTTGDPGTTGGGTTGGST